MSEVSTNELTIAQFFERFVREYFKSYDGAHWVLNPAFKMFGRYIVHREKQAVREALKLKPMREFPEIGVDEWRYGIDDKGIFHKTNPKWIGGCFCKAHGIKYFLDVDPAMFASEGVGA